MWSQVSSWSENGTECPFPRDGQSGLSIFGGSAVMPPAMRREGDGRGRERDSKTRVFPVQGSCTDNTVTVLFAFKGCQTVLSPTASEPDTTLTKTSPKNSLKGDKDPGEESEAVDGKLSIFIHKREDQSSHEVLQPLLR